MCGWYLRPLITDFSMLTIRLALVSIQSKDLKESFCFPFFGSHGSQLAFINDLQDKQWGIYGSMCTLLADKSVSFG